TGFRPDFSWIRLPFDVGEDGYPVQYRGAAASPPGLYFAGLPFLHSFASMLIAGSARDAERIARHIVKSRAPRHDAESDELVFASASCRPTSSSGTAASRSRRRYGPNQVVSESASPTWRLSPTQATCPSGRINTAGGGGTSPRTGSSHGPAYSASTN